MPIFDILRPTLYRDRATVLPKLPITANDLVLPIKFTKNLYNETMLFCNRKIPSRILAFASQSALKQLGMPIFVFDEDENIALIKSNTDTLFVFSLTLFSFAIVQCSIWNADGTFRTAPKLFSQSYTIHAHNNFSMKPIVFAALPDKYETTYSILLQALIEYAKTNNFILSPTSILIDFELSAFNAFKSFFPNANILFCHFHFAKNIIKNLKKLREYFSSCLQIFK